MDLKKIGAFIATCRKRSKLTQFELAERLGVMVPRDGVSGPLWGLKIKDKACLF